MFVYILRLDSCKIDSRTGITLYDSSWIAGVGANQNQNASETEYETEDEISIVDMDDMNPNETEEILNLWVEQRLKTLWKEGI